MRRKEDYDLQKVTILLRVGDFDCLRHFHGREGASKRIRRMVIDYIEESPVRSRYRLRVLEEDLA